MKSLTLRNLDDDLQQRLRIQAAEGGQSMEAEARAILRQAMSESAPPLDLAAAVRARIAPPGGADLDRPAQEHARPALEGEETDTKKNHGDRDHLRRLPPAASAGPLKHLAARLNWSFETIRDLHMIKMKRSAGSWNPSPASLKTSLRPMSAKTLRLQRLVACHPDRTRTWRLLATPFQSAPVLATADGEASGAVS